jgi:hypothetical protein
MPKETEGGRRRPRRIPETYGRVVGILDGIIFQNGLEADGIDLEVVPVVGRPREDAIQAPKNRD